MVAQETAPMPRDAKLSTVLLRIASFGLLALAALIPARAADNFVAERAQGITARVLTRIIREALSLGV
jgi:hypothetical protein